MVGVNHISPLLYKIPCFKKQNVGFRQAVRETFSAELGIKIPENEQSLLQNPWLRAGYGVNAYF